MRSVSTVVHLPEATNDTLALIKAARLGVERTCRDPVGAPWRYSKAGVITTDLVPLTESPRALGNAIRQRPSGLSGPRHRHVEPVPFGPKLHS
ncbi:hypothetical protein [Methylobacterium nodulans]|uniref:hypothetical protein n=1 Tax=Methylobacterium nodulans TaxID=114616 RepID=UPI00016199F4